MSKFDNWTDEEINILNIYYEKESRINIENMLKNRAWQAIQIKANRLGLHRMNYFTDEELSFISNNYSEMTNLEIGKILGRSSATITNKARELNLIKKEKWTNKETTLLKKVFGTMSIDEISLHVLTERSSSSIYHRVQELNLQKETNRYDNISNENLLQMLFDVSETIERTPFAKELNSLGLPSSMVFTTRFGSYGNACFLAGLETNKGFVRREISKSKNGELCLSLAERKITDFLIDNNIIFQKEIFYSDIINNNIFGRIRCDWLLYDGTIVEYFGMERNEKYKKKMNLKESICKEYEIDLIKIFEKDLRDLNKIFLYYI